jgi:hypothetical protein
LVLSKIPVSEQLTSVAHLARIEDTMRSSDTPPKLIQETVTDTIEIIYGFTAKEISIAWKLIGGTWHAIVHNKRGELSRGRSMCGQIRKATYTHNIRRSELQIKLDGTP